jgi:hypothetical protein
LRSGQGLEALAVLAALAGLSIFIFHAPAPGASSRFWEPYMLAPVMVWIALRFSPREVASGVLIVCAIAVAYTVQGKGPFVGGAVFEDLLFLQTFVSIGAITFLLLAAAIAERLLAERERVAVLTRERVARAEAEHAERRSTFLYRATTSLLGDLDEPLSRIELVARLVATHVGDSALSIPSSWMVAFAGWRLPTQIRTKRRRWMHCRNCRSIWKHQR